MWPDAAQANPFGAYSQPNIPILPAPARSTRRISDGAAMTPPDQCLQLRWVRRVVEPVHTSSDMALPNEQQATLNVSYMMHRVVECMLNQASDVGSFVTNREASGPRSRPSLRGEIG